MAEIAILLATFNGEKYLSDFLDSLLKQNQQGFCCYIHDDGSKDHTMEIVETYQKKHPGKFVILEGASTGSASNNFMYLASKVEEQYIMFADQDDIWLPDKIQKTFEAMKKFEKKGIPLVVHTDLRVVNSKLQTISPSYYTLERRDPRANELNQLLTKNTAAGCTMMINRPLINLGLMHRILMEKTLHDWGYMLLARIYGEIVFLNEPTILYRQHENNAVGARNKSGFRYKAEQCLCLFRGDKIKHVKNSIKIEKELVREIYGFLESDNRYYNYIRQYQEVQSRGKFERMSFYYKSGNISHSLLKVWRILFV